jgi:hypothetical protein
LYHSIKVVLSAARMNTLVVQLGEVGLYKLNAVDP